MPTVITFTETGEWQALNAAAKWCADRGISVGRHQAHAPRGLLRGDFNIQKWRNLSLHNRGCLDGVMIGDFRNGPVTVRLSYDIEPVPAEADQREVA